MKNIIITVAIVAAAIVMSACKELNSTVIYVADYAEIQAGYWKYKNLMDDVQRMKEQGDAEVVKLRETLAQLERDAQALREKHAAANDEEKKRIETEEFAPLAQQHQAQQNELTRYANEANQRIQALIQSKGQEIRLDIFKAVDRIAADKGATYILEKGSIFYGDASRDISEEVIGRINKNAPTTPATPAALPTPVPVSAALPAAATPASVVTPVVAAPEPVAVPALEAAPAATPAVGTITTPATEATPATQTAE